jgi:hypothetical protein
MTADSRDRLKKPILHSLDLVAAVCCQVNLSMAEVIVVIPDSIVGFVWAK